MCRLLGILSTASLDATYYVEKAPQSLLIQSNVNPKQQQSDGWGFGWFERGRPRLFKSPRPLYRDQKRLHQALRRPQGGVLVGHVRWASNPLKLPRNQLIGLEHTQPFAHGEWLFAHNGTLYIPREVLAELGPWARYVQGRNDSEVLFYWLMKTVIHGASMGQWVSRLRKSLDQMDAIWARCRKRHPLYPFPYHGLNWVLTNGRTLAGFCYVNPRGFGKAKALCDRRQPYYQLHMKQTSDSIAIASEPLTRDVAWKPLKHGQLVVAEKMKRQLSMRTFQVA